MANNKMEDLRNLLFEQLERLNELECKDEQSMAFEAKRAQSISTISSQLLDSAKIEALMLKELGGTTSDSQFFKNTIKEIGA